MFAVTVPDKTRETLLPIIKAHIAPGSIIRSDFWKAYDILPFVPGYDYMHEPLKGVVSAEEVNTNTIEGTWSAMKRETKVAKRNKRDHFQVVCLNIYGDAAISRTCGMVY